MNYFWEGFEKKAAWPWTKTVENVKEITDNTKYVVKELGELIDPRKAALTLFGSSALVAGGTSLGRNIGRRIGTLGEKQKNTGAKK